MSFESVSKIIKFVEGQPGWEMVRQYRQVLHCWKSVVSPQVASNTRPLFINRQVLSVATSSSAWAQNLSLQRYSLLKKLNAKLSQPLSDIRFSPANWYNPPEIDDTNGSEQASLQEQHPSFVGNDEQFITVDDSHEDDPQVVFQRWAQRRQQTLQSLPLCPRCHCPTPPGELERWSICSCCAAQQWST